MVRAYRMPERLRESLASGAGIVVESSGDPIETAERAVREVIARHCGFLVAVGDVVCTSLVEAGVTPNVCVVDGATLRRRFSDGVERVECVFDAVMRARNPRSVVTEVAMRAVKECVRAARQGIRCLVVVEGEEDLMALPAVLECSDGECVAYGLPGRGVGVMIVNERLRRLVTETLAAFEPIDI